MNNLPQDIQRFLYGQHFADGLRMALLIILPSVIATYLGYFDVGLTMSIGAMCVSISDTPGPAHHKRNSMMACCVFTFLVSFITGFLRMNVYVMGAGLTLFALFFAMFTMYGARAGFVGTSMLLLMVLQMEKVFTPMQILQNSLLLTAGAMWYSSVSILVLSLFPYKAAQRALGECIQETAEYLKLRGQLYDSSIELEEVFRRLVAQQVIVNDKQNEVRELLFKNKRIMSQSSREARAMVLTFDELVDLYERIMASHIDYAAIRARYHGSEVLQDVCINITRLSEILEQTGAAVQYNVAVKEKIDVSIPMSALADSITSIESDDDRQMMDKLLVNIQSMYRVVNDLQHYFTDEYRVLGSENKTLQHDLFVTHQDFDLKLFRYNLTFESLTFRHAVRMALACLTGFAVSKLVMHGQHSYWLLITIIFVLKPAFSLTKERNIQRISGTLIGGLIGVLILAFIHNTYVLFACMFLSMLLTYSFQRHQYRVAVVFMTPYILILFHFMHVGLVEVAEERIVDTIVGSVIALIAGYLILPDWESDQIKNYMSAMLKSNYRYLLSVRDSLSGIAIPVIDYKLARKEVYVSTSNLSAAIQRMRSEPRNTQRSTKEIQQFAVLNHLLSSQIAGARESASAGVHAEDMRLTEQSLSTLDDTIKIVDEQKKLPVLEIKQARTSPTQTPFAYIYKTATEIQQITQAIV